MCPVHEMFLSPYPYGAYRSSSCGRELYRRTQLIFKLDKLNNKTKKMSEFYRLNKNIGNGGQLGLHFSKFF